MHITLFENWFTGISRLLWDWRNTMNNLEFALEMKNKRLASGLSQGQLASLTHLSRYSINRFENGKANAHVVNLRKYRKFNKKHLTIGKKM